MKEKQLKRQPGRPSEGKQRKNIWYDADVWVLIKDLPQGERGKIVNQAIRQHLAK